MSSAPTEQKPSVLEQLRERAEKGREFAGRPDLSVGQVRMWTGNIRYLLRPVFGADSPTVAAWPTADTPVTPGRHRETLLERVACLENLIEEVSASAARAVGGAGSNRVFIGHGRSPVWRELKDFLQDRLSLPWDEFNREATAGVATTERLQQMLQGASFAFLIMTAEDEHADATFHARENVVHEVGLFQGKLGMRRAIILKEEGCQVFSNIHGLTYIGFPRNSIGATFEEIRRVLEREKIIGS
jgi:predicted nucleotide-binding protein